MEQELRDILAEYQRLGISEQVYYAKIYLYSIVTHSTAIEGSTVTEIENQLLFDEGKSPRGRVMTEQLMNLDLKNAYLKAKEMAVQREPLSVAMLCNLSAKVMKNTGAEYHTAMGDFDSSAGELRLVNVTAGAGGRSYLAYNKVPQRLTALCSDLKERIAALRESKDIMAQYILSFDAHYQLVNIHPWVDGNGRMGRLVMNYIQMLFGLVPSKINSEHKTDYIQALVKANEREDIGIFRQFMLGEHVDNLRQEVRMFRRTNLEESGV